MRVKMTDVMAGCAVTEARKILLHSGRSDLPPSVCTQWPPVTGCEGGFLHGCFQGPAPPSPSSYLAPSAHNKTSVGGVKWLPQSSRLPSPPSVLAAPLPTRGGTWRYVMATSAGSIAMPAGRSAISLSPTLEKWSGAPLIPRPRDRKIIHKNKNMNTKP